MTVFFGIPPAGICGICGKLRSGAALKLYGQLREKVRATELKGYVRDGADFGRKLRELSQLDGWKDRIEQNSRRFGPNKQKQTIWTIRKA